MSFFRRHQVIYISFILQANAQIRRPGERMRTIRGANDENRISYRCAANWDTAFNMTGEVCRDESKFCFNTNINEPGNNCPSNERCLESPNCTFAVDPFAPPNPRKPKPLNLGKQYRCVGPIEDLTQEECFYSLPCHHGYDTAINPQFGPDEEECRLSGPDSKCQLVDCDNTGLFNTSDPVTLLEGKNLGWTDFELRPFYCVSNSITDIESITHKMCDTMIPCMKDSHSDNDKLVFPDPSKCHGHYNCLQVNKCLRPSIAFSNHVQVRPGLEHKYQALGMKIVVIDPKRCVPKDKFTEPDLCVNNNSNTDLCQDCKKEVCKKCDEETSCDDSELGGCPENYECREICPFHVMHKKRGPPNEKIPYDTNNMQGKLINFTYGIPPVCIGKCDW